MVSGVIGPVDVVEYGVTWLLVCGVDYDSEWFWNIGLATASAAVRNVAHSRYLSRMVLHRRVRFLQLHSVSFTKRVNAEFEMCLVSSSSGHFVLA